jgi:hypothetical protein
LKIFKNEFWKRQFSEENTPWQDWFDIGFGIIAPIVCLIFDPAVFRDGFLSGRGYLSNIRLFAYLSIGIGITTLSIWLLFKTKSSILAGFVSGIFLVGALLAMALGIFLLPVSIFGLLVVVGILGFTPFLTAFVFLRNGVRAIRMIQSSTKRALLVVPMVLGVTLVIGIPLRIQWKTSALVSQSISTIIHSDKEEEIDQAADRLQTAFWCSDYCYDEVVWVYDEEVNEEKRQLMSSAYKKVTGEEIEERLQRMQELED